MEIAGVALAGGVIALDRVAAFQFMVSRPIVAAPIIGWILGDVSTGLQAGFLIELLWISHLPVGATVPPDETVVAILVAALSVWCRRVAGGEGEVIALALLLSLPFAVLSQRADSAVRRWNIRLAHRADSLALSGDVRGVERACLMGIGRFFLVYTLILSAALAIYYPAVHYLYASAPPFLLKGLGRLYLFIPLLGAASLLASTRVRHSFRVAAAAFIVVFVCLRSVSLG